LAAALLVASCAEGGGGGARPIEMLVATDVETLDPRYATDAVSLRATRLVHAGLVRCDPDTLAPIPAMARSWAWLSPLELRLELGDARFHSGAPLRPADVAATIRAFQSKEVGSRHARVVESIAGVREDGPNAVVVTLTRAHATLLTDLELPILRADEAFGPPRHDGTLDGLGPYKVARREQGVVELAPVSAHVPLTLRAVHDENARALRLHASRADVALNVISPTLLPALENAPGLAVGSRPGANLTYMVMRVDGGPLADPRLRHAISASIDRALLARTLLAGRAQPASTLVPPGHWAHSDAPALPFDPAGARRLLEEAGATGMRLSLLTSTDRLRGTIARTIAQELGDVGIPLDVVPLELGTMLARLASGDFEIATLQLPEMTEPNVLRVFMHSTNVPPAGANRGRVNDPEVDRLLDLGDALTEADARRRVYADLEARVRERAWILPLWHEDQVVVTSIRARDFMPSAEGRWLGLAALRRAP
jgi:peptide/nickel transport system substrate-binding protein